MDCCTAINADTGRFFSRVAGLHRLRHRLFGFERTQRQLIEGLRAGGIAGAELLEIGPGAGYLQRALLREGAVRATGVDLSERMLRIAREEAAREGLTDRISHRQGDFTLLADQIPDADVTILDDEAGSPGEISTPQGASDRDSSLPPVPQKETLPEYLPHYPQTHRRHRSCHCGSLARIFGPGCINAPIPVAGTPGRKNAGRPFKTIGP